MKNNRKQTLLALLRNRDIPTSAFRSAANELATLLALETDQFLQSEKSVTLIPIMRAGVALLPAFMNLYPSAKVGFLGISRNDATAKPTSYYQKLPKLGQEDRILLLEPMIGTGGTTELAISQLLALGVLEEKIVVVSILASQQGMNALKKRFLRLHFLTAAIDPELRNYMIYPGLGDFGDRYFSALH